MKKHTVLYSLCTKWSPNSKSYIISLKLFQGKTISVFILISDPQKKSELLKNAPMQIHFSLIYPQGSQLSYNTQTEPVLSFSSIMSTKNVSSLTKKKTKRIQKAQTLTDVAKQRTVPNNANTADLSL